MYVREKNKVVSFSPDGLLMADDAAADGMTGCMRRSEGVRWYSVPQ